ncbi:hypothetical protein L2D14_03065 [Thalassospiraceae bacterium LMO-JJ14]|nr:hypothetical protein L2D14_03065 [Thalassospiraceae bacterium LMO-JJ14]
MGYRIIGEHGPFDVLSPLCREIIEDDLKAFLASQCPSRWTPVFDALSDFEGFRKGEGMSKLDPQMKVCWIVDHFGEVPAEIIAKGIGVGKSLVYRYLEYRKRQIAGEMHPFKVQPEIGSARYYGFDVALP